MNEVTIENKDYEITIDGDNLTLWCATEPIEKVYHGGYIVSKHEAKKYLESQRRESFGGFGYITNSMIAEVALEELPEFCKRNFDKFVKHFEHSIN
jgi:hypothetical protein